MMIGICNVMSDREVSRNLAARSGPIELDLTEVQALMTYWLRRASHRLSQAHASAAEQLNLKPYEFAALSLIAGNPGITSSQLSTALGIRRPNFVGVLRDLECVGYVVRSVHAEDGRASALCATQPGYAAVARLSPLLRQVEAESIARLTSRESASLLQLLRKLCSEPRCPAGIRSQSERAARPKG